MDHEYIYNTLRNFKRNCGRLFVVMIICLILTFVLSIIGAYIEGTDVYTTPLVSLFFYLENLLIIFFLRRWYTIICTDIDKIENSSTAFDFLLKTHKSNTSENEDDIWR